jgi:hypothetical protein
MSADSRAIELIHSPPDLIRSFARSWIVTTDRSSIVTMSPVLNQPSSVNLSPQSVRLK